MTDLTAPARTTITPTLADEHKQIIRKELAMGLVLGGALPATAMYLTFGPFPMQFEGTDGFAAFLCKNAMIMGTMMTLLMTLGTRSKVRQGKVPRLAWNREEQKILWAIPRAVWLRAPLFGLYAIAVPGGIAIAISQLMGIQEIDRLPFAIAIAAASALVGIFLIPLILVAAMSDVDTQKLR